jgi:alanine dehydrogenase
LNLFRDDVGNHVATTALSEISGVASVLIAAELIDGDRTGQLFGNITYRR